MTLERHKIISEKIIEKTENSVILEYLIPEDSDFFDGHFPEIHLVPAVAQVDMMKNFALKYLGIDLTNYLSFGKRIKFTSPVFQNALVRMSIKFNQEKNSLTYKLTTQDESKTYSSGTFTLGA